MGDHLLAPASLVDRSGSLSLSAQQRVLMQLLPHATAKFASSASEVTKLQKDAVERQHAKRAVGGSFLHVSLALTLNAAVSFPTPTPRPSCDACFDT
jgi:hypothetical protein